VRFGAGLKGKLLEAMQWGTPSITSTKGAEGIASPAQWPGVVTDSLQDFADAAVKLHNDSQRWQQAQSTGTDCLFENFSKNHHSPQLLNRINELISRTTAHRQENLIGLMLRHHSHKSTQYMAQWIAAKNS
jgi:glycosyltransferase involved in cell wall biosynthesis